LSSCDCAHNWYDKHLSLVRQPVGHALRTEPIRHRKLADDVQARLLQMIQSDGLRPGDLLPSERELMDALSVGRPAIREAMQGLHRMGLLDIRHGGRARVSEPSLSRMIEPMGDTMRHILAHSPASLEHLKEARAIFEMETARIAARKRSQGDIERLQRILERQAAAQNDAKLFLECDGEFHREIAAISGNPILSAVGAAVFSWLTDFHVDLVRFPGLETLTLSEHQAILDGIAARNAAVAAKAMGDHLMRANSLYRQKANSADPNR
jgi:GntR family transcriptional regulator, sialic acid-inducible nan operon repressor